MIAALGLHEGVPPEVHVHFDTARNLLVYAWFAYRFIQAAEFHAYSSVEMALRARLSPLPPGTRATLRSLLGVALDQGLLRDDAFRHFHYIRARRAEFREAMRGLETVETNEASSADPLAYSRRIAELMPYFRNTLGHGSRMLMPHGYLWMGICCDLINQLFLSGNSADSARMANPKSATQGVGPRGRD